MSATLIPVAAQLFPAVAIPSPRTHRILDGLPPEEFAAIAPALQPVRLQAREALHEHGALPTSVYFPLDGMISLLAAAGEGEEVEVATVGREGVVGHQLALNVASPSLRAVAAVSTHAVRLDAAAFLRHVQQGGALAAAVHRYAQSLGSYVARSAACYHYHDINRRCARWLLLAHDRVGEERLQVTQELLATLLGVRRASVNGAAIALQRAGVIQYRRGRIVVSDRAGLERAACPCYAAIRAELDAPTLH
jgi:CRP-like cAMP-binding protein